MNFSQLVDVGKDGNEITKAVNKYASVNGLRADAFYHDSPIWYIQDSIKVDHPRYGKVLDYTRIV